jgi:hypothetical protein
MSAAQWTAEVTIDPATGEASLSLGAYDALGRPVEVSEEDLAKFRALALVAARQPPGLARNRRARERWVRYLRQFPLGRLRAMGREEYRGEENQELRRQRGWT